MTNKDFEQMMKSSQKKMKLDFLFSIDKFKEIKKTILFSEINYLSELKILEKEYEDTQTEDFYDNNYVNEYDYYYTDKYDEYMSIQEILVESFFVKYLFYYEKTILNILPTLLNLPSENTYYKTLTKLDNNFNNIDIENYSEHKTIEILKIIRNSLSHGGKTFILTLEEIEFIKDLVKLKFKSETFKNRPIKRGVNNTITTDIRICSLDNDFNFFDNLHKFYIDFITKLKKDFEKIYL